MSLFEPCLRLGDWLKGEAGQDLTEYALLVLFIVLVVALVLPILGNTLVDVYYNRIAPALGGP